MRARGIAINPKCLRPNEFIFTIPAAFLVLGTAK